VAVQEVRWDEDGTETADNYIFLYQKRNANHHLETDIFVHKGIRSAVMRVEFINDRMSYTPLRGQCDINAECTCTN